jgi:hypothetical protein
MCCSARLRATLSLDAKLSLRGGQSEHSQSNGRPESMVKELKHLVKS